MVGCDGALRQAHQPVNRGRLFALKIKHNHEARQMALASITPESGGYKARIGGRVRGAWNFFASQTMAEAAINAYYNEQLLAFVERRQVTK